MHFTTFASTSIGMNAQQGLTTQQQQANEGINSTLEVGKKRGLCNDWIVAQGRRILATIRIRILSVSVMQSG